MRLLYAIPLMIVLAALSSIASAYVGINLYYVLVALTALWAAFDSRRLRVQEYQSRLALDPLALGFVMAILWPIVFPGYLSLRHCIQTGHATVGSSLKGNARRAIVIAGIVAALWLIGMAVSWYAAQDLLPLTQQLNAEFNIPMSISLHNGRNLLLELPSHAVGTRENRDQLASHMAVFARAHYKQPEALDTVRVVFSTVRHVGIVTVTSQDAEYQWRAVDLTRRIVIDLTSQVQYTPLSPEVLAIPGVQAIIAQCERQGWGHCRDNKAPTDSRAAFVRTQDKEVIAFITLGGLEPDRDYEIRFQLFDPEGNMQGQLFSPIHAPMDLQPQANVTFWFQWAPTDPSTWPLGQWRLEVTMNGEVVGQRTFEVVNSTP